MGDFVSLAVTTGNGVPRRLLPDDTIGLANKKLGDLAAGTAPGDAVNKSQMDAAINVGLGGTVKVSADVISTDFAALGAADFVSTNLGAVMPANARLIGAAIESVVPFDDGDADVDVKVEIGIDGETVSNIMGTFDVDKTAAGAIGSGTPGAKGHPMCPIGGKQVTFTVVTTNAAHLAGLDAGSMTVSLFYIVLP